MEDLAAASPALEEAPPVVAVMVVRDPGPWFEDALGALAAQDYPALSILVVDAASAEDPTERVAAAVPSAFVRRLERDGGYGAAANEVLKVVKGATHLLFVHDDARPESDAVRLLLEAAYRANAGITTPKLVEWDRPDRLLAVGESADPFGRPVAVVEPGELDQGQHDAEREVLVAPGACLLVRADLFKRLGGFDPAIPLAGEDLDLCWRAALAGARTVTAPAARVGHKAALANGERASHLGDLRQLALRHRLRAALVAAPPLRFPLTLASAALASVLEAVLAVALGRRANARAALGALGANLGSLRGLLGSRRRLRPLRRGGDPAAVRRLLARRGRLGAVARAAAAGDGHDRRTTGQLVREGLGGWWATGVRRPALVLAGLALVLVVGSRHLLGGPMPQLGGLAALPEDPFQLLRGYLSGARPAGLGGAGAAPAAFALLGLAGLAALGGTGLVSAALVLGSLALGVVGAGRLARPIGSGRATAAAAVAYAAVPLWPDALARGRLAGLVAYAAAPWVLLRLLRATGLAPFGADADAEEGGRPDVGLAEAARRARRRAESRRTEAALVGAGVGGPGLGGEEPDDGGPIDERSHGDAGAHGGRPAFAPFAPFAPGELEDLDDPAAATHHGTTSGEALTEVGAQHALDEQGAFEDDVELDDLTRTRQLHRGPTVGRLAPPPAPQRSRLRQAAGLAIVLALGTALAPSLLLAAAVATLGLVVAVALTAETGAAARAGRTAALGGAGALALLVPWSAQTLGAGQWTAFTGAPGPAADAPRMLDLLRLHTGPLPVGPFPVLLLVAALLPLAIGHSWRATFAARAWGVAIVVVAVALASGRGWLGVAPIEPGVLLPFAAAALALAVALGAAAFEVDLQGYAFGWRQLLSLAAAAAVALACGPVLVGAHSGRWGAPSRSHADVLSWMPDLVAEGPFRVLWVGDPAALPLDGWHLDDGVAFATSRNGPPTAADQWAGPRRGVDDQLAEPVRSARRSQVVDLGHRLAPFGVRFVVIPRRAAPSGATERPVPADLPAALRAQIDLRQVDTNASLLVFENAAWAPARAQLPPDAAQAVRAGQPAAAIDLSAAPAVLAPSRPGSLRFRGPVAAGEVLLAEAPSRQWRLTVDGRQAERRQVLGVTGFTTRSSGIGTLRFWPSPLHLLAVATQALLWLAALAVVSGARLGRSHPSAAADARAGSMDHGDADGDGAPEEERSGVVLLTPVGAGPVRPDDSSEPRADGGVPTGEGPVPLDDEADGEPGSDDEVVHGTDDEGEPHDEIELGADDQGEPHDEIELGADDQPRSDEAWAEDGADGEADGEPPSRGPGDADADGDDGAHPASTAPADRAGR